MSENVIQWIVEVTYKQPPSTVFWGAYDNSADDAAHVPFTQEVAERIARDINSGLPPQTDAVAKAFPLIETEQPGV